MKIYVLDYAGLWLKIFLTNKPFNLYDHYNQFHLPFEPQIVLTLHNATNELFELLYNELSKFEYIDIFQQNENQYFYCYTIGTAIHSLANFFESNKSFDDYFISFITNNNKSQIKIKTIDTTNNSVENTSVSVEHSEQLTNNQSENLNSNSIKQQKLNEIKKLNLALFLWYEKFVKINPNSYTIKKDAFNHYKQFAKSSLMPELKLTEFYSAMETLGFTEQRKDNNSVFDSMELLE